jgi:predicted RNA binding protein YcfA (HicA-like mRNA interferase family)
MYKNNNNYAGVPSSSGWIPCELIEKCEGKEAIKAFLKAGGTVRHGKGDHINVKMPNGQLITIPVSGDLKIGLLKSAIRKAGLDDEEFMMLLKE